MLRQPVEEVLVRMLQCEIFWISTVGLKTFLSSQYHYDEIINAMIFSSRMEIYWLTVRQSSGNAFISCPITNVMAILK